MSRLLDFYRGEGTDTEGRRLAEIWAWDDDDLEAVHDFIQWLFPLPEPSRFNPDAPLLTEEEIRAFRADELLQANLARSFERILAFLGLTLAEGKVGERANFAVRARVAWAFPNHNWLRVTRILRSLTLLGQGEKAQALYGWLSEQYRSGRSPIPADTFRYWTAAVEGRA
jgi:hypothetical protein